MIITLVQLNFIKKIQEYNEDLASAKANRANPWLKVFAGEYVDRLEPIELK